ncbi:hypothetical protein Taro_005455 [Colocasia esculenta]|uniref:C2 NT-type domain-containing protein n=1 Tax=Colocasia esculenta TaxID=4460 RepID=A0A843TPY5_COLES|nr:hypothetical protein [Colocasia esculenta]
MASEGHPEAKLLEELDLLQRPRGPPERAATPKQQQPYSCFRRWRRPLALLDDVRRRRSRCVVCLQVHQVSGLPPCMDGRALAVGWRTRGWKGELTLPAHVRGGSAAFEEIFLHYRNADVRSTLQDFTVWVSLVDAGDCDLGTFDVDLGGVAPAESSGNPKFGGKTVSLDLRGMAKGGVLKVSVYYRVIEGQIYELQKHRFDPDGHKFEGARCGCFPRLPELRPRRTRSLTVSARRMPSLRSDTGFITIENVLGNPYPTDDEEEDEDEGFITIDQKGMVRHRARSRRPPSSNSFDMAPDDDDDDGGGGRVTGAAEPFFREATDEYDMDKVEDEFLTMLEEKQEKHGQGGGGGEFEKKDVEESLSLNLNLSFDMDVDLESLVRAAEMELNKAARVWKGRRVGGAALEKEEHEELMKRWRSAGAHEAPPSKSSPPGSGFGSPI